ncbi:hypothetical protein BOW53_07180 [Solemya pervernicosa gill symbiont]|uniref:Cytosol aminopeptidase domain-containing protein n=1 Tax=Solemya pervernicosa gill symbiont TaxID=642797 RepID=A0A1T2L6B0_9GAMM|nr:hypothetical protein BOW53_07180 [Solemya pervernicosa gill symbiont]
MIQQLSSSDTARYDAQESLLVLLPERSLEGRWPSLPYRDLFKRRFAKLDSPKAGTRLFECFLPNRRDTHTLLAIPAADATPFEQLTLARKLVAPLLTNRPGSIAIDLGALTQKLVEQTAEALVAALLSAAAEMPDYRKEAKSSPLKRIELIGLKQRIDLKPCQAEAEGNQLARWLTALPPNSLTPKSYLSLARTLARREGWQLKFHNSKALEKMGADAFLAVAKAGPTGAGIVQLSYQPPKARSKEKQRLGLVGKGICFDSGGLNIKPARHMYGMHHDMAGSAVALGTLLALSRLKVDYPVDCWLALAENHINEHAYRQGDVITALNGETIEIVHTDAEGRMVLADTLTLASRNNPALLIDYATLTGSCSYALGNRYSGAFSNRNTLNEQAQHAGAISGERVWPFPNDSDFDEALESEIADTKQCTLEGEADHILAARFLQRFLDGECDWLHLDLSSATNKGGLAHIPTEITGFGVRFTLELLNQVKFPTS